MLCSLVFLLHSLAFAQGDSSLRDDLDQARALVLAEDGDAAHARVMKIFQDYEDSVELIRHLPAIQDCLLESLFLQEEAARLEREAALEVPEIPFAATVESYKEKSGIYELRWEGEEQLGDFAPEKDLLPIPIEMEGRCRVAISLAAYPKRGQITIILESDDGRRFEVECGNASEGISGQVASVFQIEGEDRTMLERVEKKLPEPGEPIVLSLKSLGTSMQLLSGRNKILSFKIGRDFVAAPSFEGVEEGNLLGVEYDGKLDENRMSSRLETLRERQRLAFRQRVDFLAETPAWVHPHLRTVTTTLDAARPPGRFADQAAEEAWKETVALLRRERSRNRARITLSILQDNSPENLAPVQREFASMIVAFEGGYWEYAPGHAENVLEAFPDHAVTQEIMMECLARMDQGDVVWEIAMKRFQADEKEFSTVLQAVKLLMRLDMVDDVRYFLEEDESLPTEWKARCEDLLLHRLGPKTPGMRVMTSRLVEIHTDLPAELADPIDLWIGREVSRAVGFLPQDTLDAKEKLRLFLFADRWDYDEFASEILGATTPSSSGFYSPAFDAVVAWYNPVQQDREDSLRREMMIHIGKRIHPEYPLWASIGLSELVADGSIKPGKDIETLSPRAEALLGQLKAEGAMRFSVLLGLNGAGYRALEQERSLDAQAWAMCIWFMVMNDVLEVDLLEIMVDNLKSSANWTDTSDSLLTVMDSQSFLDDSFAGLVRVLNRLRLK